MSPQDAIIEIEKNTTLGYFIKRTALSSCISAKYYGHEELTIIMGEAGALIKIPISESCGDFEIIIAISEESVNFYKEQDGVVCQQFLDIPINNLRDYLWLSRPKRSFDVEFLPESRCRDCSKLLFKGKFHGEIRCPRCNALQIFAF